MSARTAHEATPRVRDAVILVAAMLLAGLVLASTVETVGDGRRTAGPLTRLERDPLDLPALRDLALGWDRQGDPDRAEAALSFVGRRTWRDPATLGWLLRSRTRDGRLTEAMEIADAILRQDGGGATRPTLFPALAAAMGDADARTALGARLDLAPPWRSEFLRAVGATGDPSRAAALFTALAAGPAPPSPSEYAPFIDRLVAAKDYAAAAAVWRDLAREPDGAQASGGGNAFAAPSDGTPFTWRPADGVGVSSNIEAAPGDAGRVALRVDYDGYASPTLPARLLVLAPGRYRISWRERLDPPGQALLSWQVRCADTGEILAREPRGGVAEAGVADGPGWRGQAMDVQTPGGACGGQWLELVAVQAERRSPITAWYESLVVARAA